MARIFADHAHTAVTTNDLALVADFLDAGTDLHDASVASDEEGLVLLVSVGNATSGEVIRRELDLDSIAGQNSDVIHPHLARNVGKHLMSILEFDPKHGIGK